jgi:glutathione synthase/RimK-type ligase-like ATP-grasp enzyme
MTGIAIATCVDQPSLTPDDALLGQALTSLGVTWSAVPWNDDEVDWAKFKGVLIRSTWDYHQHFNAFLDWIAHIQVSGIRLWNDPSILRWNLDKNYLRDLEAAGIGTIPTWWVKRGTETVGLSQIMEENRWTDVVVKPAISAGGRGLMRYLSENAALAGSELVLAARSSDLLIQPFLTEIKRGELSFVLFDGKFSHAVRKTPQRGDYRVQAKFGGSVELVKPTPSMVKQATLAASIKGKQLYARVDGLEINGRLVVMEVELVEPDLFFHLDPTAPLRLGAALKRSLADVGG